MNPPCAFCKKTVYPTEKFNCLDKIWHKGCFKCTVCSLKLTMNTYKGYDKLPYCKTHYPHLKFTAVSQTVEDKRLSNISKQQSTVEYHKEHIMSKGAKMSVSDDPETVRQKKVSQQQSNLAYQNHAAQKSVEDQHRPESLDQPVPAPLIQHRSTPPTEYDPIKELESAGKPSKKIGSIHDIKLEDDIHGFAPPPQQQQYRPPPPEPVALAPPPGQPKGSLFRAMYDYAAADTDEVSFSEGDLIINTESIDEGWMTGTVERTGETGHGGYQQAPPQLPPQQQAYKPPPQQQAYNPPPQQQAYNPPPADYDGGYAQQFEEPQPPQSPAGGDLKKFKALYDYAAADSDEISFQEDDVFNGSIVDEGWLEGTVVRTGQYGMAPRNYFEEM